MNFVNSKIFTSFLIGIVYYIIKSIYCWFDNSANKLVTQDDDYDEQFNHKYVLRESILIIIVSYVVLVFKDKIFTLPEPGKVDVFTNQPNF